MKKIIYVLSLAVMLITVLTTCKDVSVIGVKLNEISVTLAIGETKTLMATVIPENATNKTVTWTSSNPEVATVSTNGLVTPLSNGITTISVTTVDGNYSENCIVKVSTPTKETLLTQENGWILSSATSTPPFESYDGIVNENLFVSFFFECELDDIMYFNKNKLQVYTFGKMLCEWDYGQFINLGSWHLLNEETELEFYLPYFFDEDDSFAKLVAKIVILDKNTLQLLLPLSFDDGTKKAKRVLTSSNAKETKEYEFTLTYKKFKNQ